MCCTRLTGNAGPKKIAHLAPSQYMMGHAGWVICKLTLIITMQHNANPGPRHMIHVICTYIVCRFCSHVLGHCAGFKWTLWRRLSHGYFSFTAKYTSD